MPGGLAQRPVNLELEEVGGEEAHVVHARLPHAATRPEVKVVLSTLVWRGDTCMMGLLVTIASRTKREQIEISPLG